MFDDHNGVSTVPSAHMVSKSDEERTSLVTEL